MKKLFEYFGSKNIRKNNIQKIISNWDSDHLYDFVEQAQKIIRTVKRLPSSSILFNFTANSELSGDAFPCGGYDCRMKSADRIAKFAALYSDCIKIINPFDKYNGTVQFSESNRLDLIYDLKILYFLKPLIEEGYIEFSISRWNFCPECYSKIISNFANANYKNKLEKAKRYLTGRYLRESTFTFSNEGDYPPTITFSNYDFLDHQNLISLENIPPALEAIAKRYRHKKLSKELVVKAGFVNDRVTRIIDDILLHNYYSIMSHSQYITNRDIDLKLIKFINDSETNHISNAIIKGLAHALPVVTCPSLQKMVKLRKNEGEAFQVYRDALQLALSQVTYDNANKSKQIFDDIVRPELNKINHTLRNSRSLLKGSLREDLLFGAGFITIGLYSGLLPSNVGQIMAALGGFHFTKSILKQLNDICRENPDVKQNKFYFLWKVDSLISTKH